MYQNPIYICISWCSKICWFLVKKCWCQQNSRDVSRDLYIFWIFLRSGITLPSVIIVGYVWEILERRGSKKPPPPHIIREQLWKSPSWIGLNLLYSNLLVNGYSSNEDCNLLHCIRLQDLCMVLNTLKFKCYILHLFIFL